MCVPPGYCKAPLQQLGGGADHCAKVVLLRTHILYLYGLFDAIWDHFFSESDWFKNALYYFWITSEPDLVQECFVPMSGVVSYQADQLVTTRPDPGDQA